MSIDPDRTRIIWATRGRSWGFRFLLDGGLGDPLPEYEHAFGELRDAPTAWRREGRHVALRILDLLGIRDTTGRVFPHEFVIFGDLADTVDSVEDGAHEVWPLVADANARVWDADPPHSDANLRRSVQNTPSSATDHDIGMDRRDEILRAQEQDITVPRVAMQLPRLWQRTFWPSWLIPDPQAGLNTSRIIGE